MPSLPKRVLQKNLIKTFKIIRGDLVCVTAGKDKGKQGVVKKVIRQKNRILVSGIGMVKKHKKKTREGPGSVVMKENPIHYSNVALVCPETGKPTRVGYKFTEDGKKVRYAKVSGAMIPVPEAARTKKKRPTNIDTDTTSDVATKLTYQESELIELKNQYLKRFELCEFNTLKQKYEASEKKKLYSDVRQLQFEKEVYERAKEIYNGMVKSQASAADSQLPSREEAKI